MFSVLSIDPVSSDRVLILGEGVSRRTGLSTRPQRAFSWRVETLTRTRRGFSGRAKTRTRNRRVLLSPRSTALARCIGQVLHFNTWLDGKLVILFHTALNGRYGSLFDTLLNGRQVLLSNT